MPGPRRDKELAWGNLDFSLWTRGINMTLPGPRQTGDTLLDAFNALKDSGRFDARQILAIKQFAIAIIDYVRSP